MLKTWLRSALGPRRFSLDDPQLRAKLECHLRQDPWLCYVAADVNNGSIGQKLTWEEWCGRATFANKTITRWRELYPKLPTPEADAVHALLRQIVSGHAGADFILPMTGLPPR